MVARNDGKGLRHNLLRGYDVCSIYLIVIALLSFPQAGIQKMKKSDFYETILYQRFRKRVVQFRFRCDNAGKTVGS